MDSRAVESVKTNLESLRMACDGAIVPERLFIDALTTSFRESFSSIRSRAQETVQSQGKLVEVKARLREAEDDLVKALSVKNRKEAKRIALIDSLTASKARVEELKMKVHDQRAKRDAYAAIISKQLSVSEETNCQNEKGEIQEAISWYNRVLGFHVEGGHGVRFIFKNISMKNPNEEFSFTIRHADDTYTLLDCDPHLDDVKELILELNRMNGLFKFVRIMRQKFQEAAAQGLLPEPTSPFQESAMVSTSAPALSISIDRSESLAKKSESLAKKSESLAKKSEHHVQRREGLRSSKKQNRGKGAIDSI
ncbi:hypothetical protein L484_014567 [Morus notabilis]|uniref:Kinetochore protein SPC25 n=1 Tax=Morus notabilis TaxID=981085 RepID=W9S7J7_9ROSA|nr:kinetochore protein spc25 [Morus notabilis]EXB93575.1 hypothetical protein L484_014567 [Morus notabilis]